MVCSNRVAINCGIFWNRSGGAAKVEVESAHTLQLFFARRTEPMFEALVATAVVLFLGLVAYLVYLMNRMLRR